jgi:hypothetical protein
VCFITRERLRFTRCLWSLYADSRTRTLRRKSKLNDGIMRHSIQTELRAAMHSTALLCGTPSQQADLRVGDHPPPIAVSMVA